jgi:hypothetical protein
MQIRFVGTDGRPIVREYSNAQSKIAVRKEVQRYRGIPDRVSCEERKFKDIEASPIESLVKIRGGNIQRHPLEILSKSSLKIWRIVKTCLVFHLALFPNMGLGAGSHPANADYTPFGVESRCLMLYRLEEQKFTRLHVKPHFWGQDR